MAKMMYVYFITNYTNRVLYIGVTNDLQRRIYEHKFKIVKGFTEKYNLSKLVYFEVFENAEYAILREKQMKKWRRDKKDVLVNKMNPEWIDLYENL
jgi:putative endonuclease